MHYTAKLCHALHSKGLPYIIDQQVALWHRQCIECCLGVLRYLPPSVVGGAGVVVVGAGVVVVGAGVVVVGSSDVVVGDEDSTVVVVSSQDLSSVEPSKDVLSSSLSASKALGALKTFG